MILKFPANRSDRDEPQAPTRRLLAVGILSALLGSMVPATATTIFPIKGGSGDAGFQDRCPPSEYLIGFAGRTGAFTDQIGIVCAPVLPDGTHGALYHGPARGGNGGAALEFSCNANAFVAGLTFEYYDKHAKVFDLQLTCRASNGATTLLNFGPSQGVSFMNDSTLETERCSSDELASGLAGRYGANVNAIGLFCDAVTAAPAPARSTLPIRQTGKAVPASAGALACPQGFVWREASATDHVCVTPQQRRLTRFQNAAAASHISQTDQTYGPSTCEQGYVWRQAFDGDTVCVTPQERDAAAQQNAVAPAQIPVASP